ncbi:MAG: hypothetical protein GY702_15955 [Desulfobulbaceae bacterium]|nr:hypothetical protein [Desulfobulbaceae bacterium]
MKKISISVAAVALLSAAVFVPVHSHSEGVASTTVADPDNTAVVMEDTAPVSTGENPVIADSGVLISIAELENVLAQDKANLELSGKFLWVGYATAAVNARKSDPSWGKSRIIAAQKAVIEAENKFAKEYGQKIASDKIREYYSDESGVIPDYDFGNKSQNENQYLRIINKLLTLNEVKLDNALAELGISPEELQQSPPKQRHLLFADRFESSVKREAIANLSGLLTFKTYEGFGDKGEYHIAALLVLSDKMKQLAYQMAKTNSTMVPDPLRVGSKQMEGLVAAPAVSLIPDFGVKRLYDVEGYPVLVSFGQWSSMVGSSDSKKMARKREAAYKQAEALADQGLAEFVNGHINYSSLNTIGETERTDAVVDVDNFKSSEDIAQLTDSIREKAVKKSRVRMVGVRELRRWSGVHPDNTATEVFGVIRYWSPVNAENMNKVRNWKPKKTRIKQAASSAQKSNPSIKGSQERMSINDF